VLIGFTVFQLSKLEEVRLTSALERFATSPTVTAPDTTFLAA